MRISFFWMLLLAILSSGCVHHHDLLEDYKDLDLYIHKGVVEVKACNGESRQYSGWPIAIRDSGNGHIFVHGVFREEQTYTFWRCEERAFNRIGGVYGFLHGEPVYTGEGTQGKYVVWGNEEIGPFDSLVFYWSMTRFLEVPFFISTRGGKIWVGFGQNLQGPFDAILKIPTVDRESKSVRLIVLIGNLSAEIFIRPAEYKETDTNYRIIPKAKGI